MVDQMMVSVAAWLDVQYRFCRWWCLVSTWVDWVWEVGLCGRPRLIVVVVVGFVFLNSELRETIVGVCFSGK